jgi:Tfp pilus assembly protein PilV
MRAAVAPHGYHCRAGGFTFVEVLAAMLFLALVVPVIVSALAISNRTSLLAERGAIAAEMAENKLNEMLIGNLWQSAPSTRGDFGADLTGYRWEISTADWTGDTTNRLTELGADVYYTVQGREYKVHLSTLVDPTATAATSSSTTGGAQ